ncbi:uncharacterized protein [Miscanthus floridulus]|uniref:uncharacterized protein n=1 Tax=Miscanthus floridulus TaxID=154761 RepID=UPI0034590661
MAAAPSRALAADKRWGFAAAAAAPGRPPAAGVVEAAPKPTILPTQRGALPWVNRPMPPAPNAWGSSSLLSLKKGEGSGSFFNINDRPSSSGSSSTSTDESDLLDSPVACGLASHDSVTAISRSQSTELRSGSWKFAHSQVSFLDVLKAPLRTIAKKRFTSHRKGFTICADDLPVLDSKNSQSNGQQGHSFQGRSSFSSVVIAARDEQRKIPLTGGDPVSTANFSWEPKQAQLHATQTPDICMPPPCIDYWHPPPDHPPDRNGICLGGVVSYGPCNPADKTVSFPVESFTHDGQSVLNQGGEERHGPHGVYHPKNNDSCYANVPVDTFVKSLPHLILEKVKDNHSDALEKQPVIEKDVALLEKINCLPHHILGKVKVAATMAGLACCSSHCTVSPSDLLELRLLPPLPGLRHHLQLLLLLLSSAALVLLRRPVNLDLQVVLRRLLPLPGGGAGQAASVPTASGTFEIRLQRFASSLSRDAYLRFGSA